MTSANKIKLVDNRVERAKSFLLYQFQDKQNINKIVEALVEELQEAENTLIDLQDLRTLENAFGNQLDNIGDKLKVRRNSLNDDEYKVAIKVRILRRNNKGTSSDIRQVIKLLTSDPSPQIKNTHPYVVELSAILECLDSTSSSIDEVVALFPINTGVRFLDRPSKPFGFAGNSDAFPLNSTSLNQLNSQISSLITTRFGIAEDNRFKTSETFIPPKLNLPNPTIPPTIEYEGDIKEGTLFTINDGVWSGDTPISFKYQWFRDGNSIDGETTSTYTVLLSDLDLPIYCRVIASNLAGSFVVNTESETFTTIPTGGIVEGLGLSSNYSSDVDYIGVLPPPTSFRTSVVGLVFGTDGRVSPFKSIGTFPSYDYLETTGVGAAANYQVRFDEVSGSDLTSPAQIGIWQNLTSERTFSLSITSTQPTYSFSSGVFDISIKDVVTGIVETKRVTLSALLSIDSGL